MLEPHSLRALLALLQGRKERFLAALRAVDGQCFVNFCSQHQLAGYAHILLQEIELPTGFSSEIIRQLRVAYLRQWDRSETLRRALEDLAERFEAAGEEFILLKGFHLAEGFYGNYDRRSMHDLDLLVRRSCFGSCCQVLMQAGYEPQGSSALPNRLVLSFIHHLEFEKPQVPLDLHHQIRTHPSLRIAEDDLWNSRDEMEIAGQRLQVLCGEHTLLVAILTIHADIGLGTITLRSLVDLLIILRRLDEQLDWAVFLDRRQREGTAQLCLNVLALFLIVFECEEQFPNLRRAVEAGNDRLVTRDKSELLQLLGEATLDRKKRWAFECYEYPLWRSAGWWLASLPVQLVAYRKTFFRDLGRRLLGQRQVSRQQRGASKSEQTGSRQTGSRQTESRQTESRQTESRQTGSRQTGSRQTEPGRSVAISAAAKTDLVAFGLETSAFEVAICRFGSLTTRFFTTDRRYRQIVEELFRIEMEEVDDSAAAAAEIYIFDTDLKRLRSQVAAPLWPLLSNPADGVVEVHHQIASVFLRTQDRPQQIMLPIRSAGVSEAHLLHSVMIAVYKMLWCLGRVQLHAAAVEIGGLAHVFIGDRGAGKTTICLKLARTGGIVLGEDHLMIRRRSSDLEDQSIAGRKFAVSGCDVNMRLTAKTEEHFFREPLAETPRDYAGVLKKEVEAARLLDSQPYRDVAVGKLFFTRVGERFQVKPVSRARAVVRLLDGIRDRHRFSDRVDMAAFLDFFADLVAGTECLELTLSQDLDNLDQLVSLLEGR